MADFEVPELKEYPIIPKLKEGVMAHSAPFVAAGKFQTPLGYPEELVDNWKEVAIDKMGELLGKFRSLQVFLDACVHCGACTDKCHYYLGTSDANNMPVARQELLRKVYRRYFTFAGKYFPKLVGAADLTEDVLDEWYSYYHQCSQCRRCSVFCPYGIDTAEITMIARELLNLVGLNVNWVIEPVANCFRFGNHLAIQPHGLVDTLEFMAEDIEEATGIRADIPINKKGAEILFVTPSGDFVADPGIFTCMGYMLLFHELGIDYTWSTYASDGGNFGLFTSHEMMKRLNAKIYADAKRLGVKYSPTIIEATETPPETVGILSTLINT